jgi:hypothetical protein
MQEIDIWRTAGTIISIWGDEAALVASMRADNFLESGDMEAFLVWRRVIAAVKAVQRKSPAADERVH